MFLDYGVDVEVMETSLLGEFFAVGCLANLCVILAAVKFARFVSKFIVLLVFLFCPTVSSGSASLQISRLT